MTALRARLGAERFSGTLPRSNLNPNEQQSQGDNEQRESRGASRTVRKLNASQAERRRKARSGR